MSTDADRSQVVRLPLPPLAPPRPAEPPRPASPPPPSTPPLPRTAPDVRRADGDEDQQAAERGAEPIPQDEPTARVTPRKPRDSREPRNREPRDSGESPRAEREESGREVAGREDRGREEAGAGGAGGSRGDERKESREDEPEEPREEEARDERPELRTERPEKSAEPPRPATGQERDAESREETREETGNKETGKETGRPDAGRERSGQQPPRTVRRPPFPAMPPQPPPPTGVPIAAGQGIPAPRMPYDDISGPPTFRLRPIRVEEPRRPAPRTVAALACLVLGVGLLGGTAAGTVLTGDAEAGATASEARFDEARGLWHTVPVDALFPRAVRSENAGPGGADRHWTRVAVAPDSSCRYAFDPLLTKALSPVGCRRLLRATYADETSSSVTTVGILVTKADSAGMHRLRERFAEENLTARTDLMPRPYAARGTLAAAFGDAQRASWTIRVLTQAPAVVYAVSGFADGRTVSDPQPADGATEKGETSSPAQAGLGHEAQGLADRIERGLINRIPDTPPEDAS